MYDFAIIGSGVSGGRIAYELTKGGAQCVLLEAGREFHRGTYPGNEMDYTTQMFWNGGLEVTRDGRVGLLRGKCLGGTSVVNQADLDRFDELALTDWRDRSGCEFFNLGEMNRLYEYLVTHLAMGEIAPEHYNANARVFLRGLERLGYGWHPLVRAQTDCALAHGSDCIVCLGGCPRDAKQSALVTTIREARRAGMPVETEFEAQQLLVQSDRVVVRGIQHGARREIVAARAVLAAGALGNTALLMRSPEIAAKLPALGHKFCCHPQLMSYGVFEEPVDSHKGALQSVQTHDERLRRAGIKLENVFAPPIATAMLMPGIGRRHARHMRRYRHLASIEVAIRDDPIGRIRLDRRQRIVVDKPLSRDDRGRLDSGRQLIKELLVAGGAREVIECRQAYGLHLMGGCAIGIDATTSVVSPDFQMHGHPRLWAADSSIFPSAPGINPSFTIMALSYTASQSMLAR